jgi:hypothetical protein
LGIGGVGSAGRFWVELGKLALDLADLLLVPLAVLGVAKLGVELLEGLAELALPFALQKKFTRGYNIWSFHYPMRLHE